AFVDLSPTFKMTSAKMTFAAGPRPALRVIEGGLGRVPEAAVEALETPQKSMFFDMEAVRNGAWAAAAPENDNAAPLIVPTLPGSRFYAVRLPAPEALMRGAEIQPRKPEEKP